MYWHRNHALFEINSVADSIRHNSVKTHFVTGCKAANEVVLRNKCSSWCWHKSKNGLLVRMCSK